MIDSVLLLLCTDWGTVNKKPSNVILYYLLTKLTTKLMIRV